MSPPTRRKLPSGAYRIQEQPTTRAITPPVSVAAPQQSTPPRPSTGVLGRPRRGLSLRVRLIVALVGVALVPLTATAIAGVQLARTSLIHQNQQVLLSSAGATAAEIDAYLAEVRSSLVSSQRKVADLVAGDPSLRPDTVRAIEAVLQSDSAVNGFEATAAVEYVDRQGIVAASSQSGEEGEDLGSSQAVQAALATALLPACQTAPADCAIVSGPAYDPTAPIDLRETLEVLAPVYAANAGPGTRPTGTLRARFSMQGKIVGPILRDAGQGGGGLLVERDTGLILAGSLPVGNLTFSSLAPLSAEAAQDLKRSKRYAGDPPVRPIPGLPVGELTSQCAHAQTTFSAGMIGHGNASDMLYACVGLKDGPNATPWVYVLGRSTSDLTAPADNLTDLSRFPDLSLAQTAVLVALVALVLGLAAGMFTARWTSTWLIVSVRQLGATASAFLAFAGDQRQAAEEQRHRLTAARTALHDIHRTAGELAQAIQRAIAYAEDAPLSARTDPSSSQSWWAQWSVAMQERLARQQRVCNGLAEEAGVTAAAASNMRQRGIAVAERATAIEAALVPGGMGAAGSVSSSSDRPAPGTSSHFRTGTLRSVLLGLLVALGLLPSLGFVATTNAVLRGDLAGESNQVLFGEGESRAQAVDALVAQQQLQVIRLDLSSGDLLQPAAAATASDFGTELLALANPQGRVVAASQEGVAGTDVSSLPIFASARTVRLSVMSPVYYDPTSHTGWYYIAAPIRSSDKKQVVGVALGKFNLAPLWRLIVPDAQGAAAQEGTFTLVIEPADGIVLADSRQPSGQFGTLMPLGPSTLDGLWSQSRYPRGQTPPVQRLPEVASALHASGAASSPAPFTGASGAGGPMSEYRLIKLANAPWYLAEAQPILAATQVADQLTRYDLILSLFIVALTAGLAFLLGQSIILPVRRLRSRFRQAARRLVAITRHQDEAAQRQQVALPPIEATARLLALETEEVGQLLFGGQRALPAASYAPPAPMAPVDGPGVWPMQGGGDYVMPPSLDTPVAMSSAWPPAPASPTAPDQPPMEVLRRARILADDWSLRQQRILADLATALNATDELSRGSIEGQREAAELSNLAVDLLAGVR